MSNQNKDSNDKLHLDDNEDNLMNTMTEVVNKVVKAGYTDSFKVTENGLQSNSRGTFYSPEQITVVNYYRFEGQSDPADNNILYVIETEDNLKGTLIDAYGAYADEATTKFMETVEEIQKKIKTDKKQGDA